MLILEEIMAFSTMQLLKSIRVCQQGFYMERLDV